MKKIILSSFILLFFSLSIFVFELSCRKSLSAQTSNSETALNKILISKGIDVQTGSTIDSLGNSIPVYHFSTEYYLMNNDGSNVTKINVNLPAGIFATSNARLSADGQKLIFSTNNNSFNSIYSCSLDGSGLTKLIDGDYALQDAR